MKDTYRYATQVCISELPQPVVGHFTSKMEHGKMKTLGPQEILPKLHPASQTMEQITHQGEVPEGKFVRKQSLRQLAAVQKKCCVTMETPTYVKRASHEAGFI